MDEVITCGCKSQWWVIGASGTRCGQCGFWLYHVEPSHKYNINVTEANDYIKSNYKAPAVKPRGKKENGQVLLK